MPASSNASTPLPPSYATPPFPSLYILSVHPSGHARYLYRIKDIWRFNVYWTFIVFELVHLAVAVYAVGMMWVGRVHEIEVDDDDGGDGIDVEGCRDGPEKTATHEKHRRRHGKEKEKEKGLERGAFDTAGLRIRRAEAADGRSRKDQQDEDAHASIRQEESRDTTEQHSPTEKAKDGTETHKTASNESRPRMRKRVHTVRPSLALMWIIPLVYVVVAGVEAVVAGSVVGLLSGAIYNAGGFNMSTWMPLVWAVINILILIVSSYSIQGGL